MAVLVRLDDVETTPGRVPARAVRHPAETGRTRVLVRMEPIDPITVLSGDTPGRDLAPKAGLCGEAGGPPVPAPEAGLRVPDNPG